MPASSPQHPSPGRGRISRLTVLVGMAGVPGVWVTQMLLSQILASNACYPYKAPLPAPYWHQLPQMLLALNAFAVILAACLTGLALSSWRKTRGEKAGGSDHVVEVGEGRTRFLTMLGLLASLLFDIAILFTACANWLIAPCKGWGNL